MTDARIMPQRVLLSKFQSGIALPESPLLIAGGLGGPLIIGSLTPLRNACTLAAQDGRSSMPDIYRKVFNRGLLGGWTGLTGPSCAAAVQFTMLGPGYHLYLGLFGSPAAAVAAGALTETFITYGPTTRNSQLMHNQISVAAKKVAVRPLRPVGPGFATLVLRNIFSNAGIRVFSDPFSSVLAYASGEDTYTEPSQIHGAHRMGGDFCASVMCGAVSMPFNQLYNFQVTSAASIAGGSKERAVLGLKFLKAQYLVTSADGSFRLSRIVARDAFLRSFYIGCMFGSYATIERLTLNAFR